MPAQSNSVLMCFYNIFILLIYLCYYFLTAFISFLRTSFCIPSSFQPLQFKSLVLSLWSRFCDYGTLAEIAEWHCRRLIRIIDIVLRMKRQPAFVLSMCWPLPSLLRTLALSLSFSNYVALRSEKIGTPYREIDRDRYIQYILTDAAHVLHLYVYSGYIAKVID